VLELEMDNETFLVGRCGALGVSVEFGDDGGVKKLLKLVGDIVIIHSLGFVCCHVDLCTPKGTTTHVIFRVFLW
jgi:hypothetical protein